MTSASTHLSGADGARGVDLRSLNLEELTRELVEVMGERPFRARQIFAWLHKRHAGSFAEMTDVSAALRERLETSYRLDTLRVMESRRSDDGTRKLALGTVDGACIEAVHIPEWKDSSGGGHPERPPDRSTLCISTQVGCAMGCAFCLTGTMGLERNLSVGEILDQVYRACALLSSEGAGAKRPISNLVFMGMGEPLSNYENVREAISILLSPAGLDFSHRHVTVSTCGVVPNLDRLGRETEVKVAISLTGTNDAVRDELMPINRRWPLAELLGACRRLPLRRGRRITFEYVLIDGVTDSLENADELASLLRGLPSKINLIQYNENEGLPYRRPPDKRVRAFRDRLLEKGLNVVTRRSRGVDIGAACGQLASRKS